MFISIKNLTKIYDNNSSPFKALSDVSLNLESGKIGALVGASGSGKTTLLNIIGALDKTNEGFISINGNEIHGKNDKELCIFRRENLGFIFQSYNLIPVLNTRENVSMALFDLSENEKKERSNQILKLVGLEGKELHFPNQLSGGEQQRVSIARALVKRPKLLLADEPTANLDSMNGKQILDLIASIGKKTEITILFSTHDERVMDISEEIFVMKDGHLSKGN